MAGEYEKPMSVKDAVDKINNNTLLLPAIQRKFVWSSRQICVLFDSILQGYPINTFMFWEINDEGIKKEYQFYEFLKYYCHRFNEENIEIKTNASFHDFNAVIDGQQRLTSLYIGLCGTYAYKQPRVWWPTSKDDKILPPRKLYIDLKEPANSEDEESLMFYNFKFLTENQYRQSLADSMKHHWFCMHEILNFPEEERETDILLRIILPELKRRGLSDNDFSRETLFKLYTSFRKEKVIHHFKERSQEIDHVLDVFIRTNSGGTKLDFSDLLMSIAVAHWDGNFRKEIDDVTRQIHNSAELGFFIERDWILKTCLMLTDVDVRFKIRNFNSEQVKKIQNEWHQIKECILESFKLVRRYGINPQSLTSKNAVIPICYYLYKRQEGGGPLYLSINNLAKVHKQREKIGQWFYMVLLKGVFGGQSDSILQSMREILKSNIQKEAFPLDEIIDRYKATNKDLRFDEEYVESMLDIQHGEGRCRALLHLLFPEKNETELFHIDHLHPKKAFRKTELKKYDFLNADKDLMDFYSNQQHWNSMANLHLLNESQNQSKNDSSLDLWLSNENIHISKVDLFVEGIDLSFSNFKEFYHVRRAQLKQRLIERVYMTASIIDQNVGDEPDEEVEDLLE